MALPESAKVVVIGAGVHGLSTSWHLAKELEARGLGSGEDVVVLDKTGVGAGPSGLACGVIRNNYFQPAMRELMAHSVEVWESDPEAFHYHPVGYLQIAPEVMHEDVATIHEQQRAIGYTSDLIEGEDACRVYMESIFSDWQAKNVTVVLHEKKGGYAESMPSMLGLRAKGEALGVRLVAPVTVAGFESDGGAVSRVVTDRGDIACEQVVVAAGPWVRDLWHMLDLPGTVTVRGRDGKDYERPMWTYWCLVEGTLGVDPSYLLDNDGEPAAGGAPGHRRPADRRHRRVASSPTSSGASTTSRTSTSAASRVGPCPGWSSSRPTTSRSTRTVPRAPSSSWARTSSGCGPRRSRTATSGSRASAALYRRAPTGGIGAFTPDSFPVFDTFRENVHVIADSNHGYKMIGVGALVAKEVLGERQALFEPFRFSRYAEGKLHPVSHSPFPWS